MRMDQYRTLMTFPAQVYKVLIASPSDLPEEREAVRAAIHKWNSEHAETMGMVLLPSMWEADVAPAYGQEPQAIINRGLVDTCDMLVGLFWKSIGSKTSSAASGTIEEIERVAARGRRVMLYFSRRPIDPNTIDPAQLTALRAFREACRSKSFYREFSSTTDLSDQVRTHLLMVQREIHLPAEERIEPNRGFVLDGDQLVLRATLEYEDYFATEPDQKTCVLDEARVLLSAKPITNLRDLIPILEQVSRAQVPILFICPGVEGEALATLATNVKRKTLKTCPISLKHVNRDTLKAIQNFTGAALLGELGHDVSYATLDDLGVVRKATIEPSRAILLRHDRSQRSGIRTEGDAALPLNTK